MGLLPFIALAAAIKSQEERESRARAARSKKIEDDRGYYKSSNTSGYRYHSPSELPSVEFEDITDEQTRAFVEGFFAYRQSKIDEYKTSLQAKIDEKKKEFEECQRIEEPMKQREDKAREITSGCLNKVEGKDAIKHGHGYNEHYDYEYSAKTAFGRAVVNITSKPLFKKIQGCARDSRRSELQSDFEALHGVALEDSEYYKHLQTCKKGFYKEMMDSEEKLSSLEKQLKHTIWLPKRKQLKEQIRELTEDIQLQKSAIPDLDRLIKGYCDFYNEVASLSEKDKEAILDSLKDSESGARKENYYRKNRLDSEIGWLKRDMEKAELSTKDLFSEYIDAHPEYTEDDFENIEKGVRSAEKQKRDAIGEKTGVYKYGETSIAHEIKTDELCRLVRNAQYDARNNRETENE